MPITRHCEKCWDVGLLLGNNGITRCGCITGWVFARKYPAPEDQAFRPEQPAQPSPAPEVHVEYLPTRESIYRLIVWFCIGVIVGIGMTRCF